MKRLRSFLRNVFRRQAADHELHDELAAHLDLLAAEKMRQGMSPAEARRAARVELGGVEQVKEEVRAARAGARLEQLWQDARFGARQLRRNPGFTAVAVLMLALGIGANTALFSAVDSLLLRPLPVADSERLVSSIAMREGFDPFGTSLLEFAAFRDRSHSFVLCGLAETRSFNLLGRNEPERIPGAAVQADFLATFGVSPMIGRTFAAEEDRPGGASVALLSYGLWKRRFGGDPQVAGQSLNLNGRMATVIGVLPPAFDFPAASEIWIPLQADFNGASMADLAAHSHIMVARLRPGVRVEQADAELRRIARDLEKEYPQVRQGWSVKVIPLRQDLLQDLAGRVQKSLKTLLAAVGFLLFICCANVSGLLLARGATREREIALRQAVGAGWGRIVSQLVTESLLLALAGGLGGLLLAWLILPVLSSLNPVEPNGFAGTLRSIHLDGRALVFMAVVTALTGLASGLLPAFKTAGSRNLMSTIQEGGQRSGRGLAGRRLLAALVVSEMAIAFALLSSGGLVIQSFRRLQHIELGFRSENLLAMHMELSPEKYREFPQRVAFEEKVVDRVQHLPGVVSAGATTNIPVSAFVSYDSVFEVEGHPTLNPADVPITAHRLVSPGYLETLGVTLVKGRLLNEYDRADTLPVAVISEELARQAWPKEDPIGKRIRRVRPGVAESPWLTVVGVVRDVKEDRYNFRINRPVWYLPYAQQANTFPLDLVVRMKGDAAGLAAAVRRAVLEVDPDQPVSNVTTMNTHLAGMLVTERFSAILMSALALLGVLLAVIGLYGVTAYTVSKQTTEIGMRLALGARPADIYKMVLGRGARLILIGLLAGLLCAAGLVRLLAGTLYGVEANDPRTFGFFSLLLALVALAACYLPARRATRVSPMFALRGE
jgi:putative ABC transport system permease protein